MAEETVEPDLLAPTLSVAGEEQPREWLAAAFAAQAARGDAHALSALQIAELGRLSRALWWADDDPASARLVATLLPAAVRAAVGFPGGSPTLALYLRELVVAAWEDTWDHTRLREVVGKAVGAWEAVADEDVSGAAAAPHWALLGLLEEEFDVEVALCTGRLPVIAAVAARAERRASALVRQAESILPASEVEAVLDEARRKVVYYQTVRGAAEASDGVLRGRSASARSALRELSALVEKVSFSEVNASELRGHLAGLGAIVAAERTRWLRVDAGRLRIVYPFSTRSRRRDLGQHIVELVAAARGWRLGGVAVTDVAQGLYVSDAWQGADPLGRAYRGAVLRLDDLTLESASGETELVRASVRLSELGNHVVVFDIDLAGALPGRIAEIAQLASPTCGDLTELPADLRLHPAGHPEARLPRLATLVADILTDLGSEFAGSDRVEPITVASLEGSFGVMTTILRASALAGPRDRVGTPVTQASEILDLFGVGPLVHPLPTAAVSIADWALYDLDQVAGYRLLALNDELLAANANMTLLAGLHAPDYVLTDLESYIEFAHSMHGMYQGWQETVREHVQSISDILHEVNAELPAEAEQDELLRDRVDRLGRLVVRIEREELRLQSFVQSTQATILFVESPALVTSPALRIDLDTILRSNRYQRLRDAFDRAVHDVMGSRLQELLAVCHRRIELAVEQQREQRDARVARIVQAVGIGLALIGVSGLVSVLQSGLELKGDITWWLVAVILSAAFVIGLVIYARSGELPGRRSAARKASVPEGEGR